jgi:hypothetical protein
VNWADVAALHDRAAAQFAADADSVDGAKWLAPRAEGKWSPAEVVEHLNRTYDVLLRELAGYGGMAIRTKWWQRILLRFTIVPKILRGDGFPSGARAPRETRPELTTTDQRALVDAFRDRARRFSEETARARGGKLTHAYFGRASVARSVLLCARHIEHHTKQL